MDFVEVALKLPVSEDSKIQLKEDIHNCESLATEMAAFANAEGGTIYIGINDSGVAIGLLPPDISRINNLMHRDYMVNSTIRLFIYDNRIEIISPGHLPDNLTVDKILEGKSNARNCTIVSYIAKGLLPYKGLGSGIKRAKDAWTDIEFEDDREAASLQRL